MDWACRSTGEPQTTDLVVGTLVMALGRRMPAGELIHHADPLNPRALEDVELATLGWVHWHTTARLHGCLDDVPPTEFEAAFYAARPADPAGVGIQ